MYFRELFRLLGRRWENPVIRQGAPWRRSFIVKAGFYGYLAGLAILALLGFGFQRLAAGEMIAFGYYSTLIVVPALVLFFSFDLRQPGTLEAVELTLLRRHEVAFGSVFWGALLPLPFLALNAGLILCKILLREWWDWEDLFFGLGLYVYLAAVFWLKCIQSWLRLPKHRWGLILRAPSAAAFEFIRIALAVETAYIFSEKVLNLDDHFSLENQWQFIVPGVPIGLWLLIWQAREAGRYAGAAYFAPLAPDDYRRVNWFARETATAKLSMRRRLGNRPFFHQWVVGLPGDFLMAGACLAAAGALSALHPMRESLDELTWIFLLPVFGLLAVSLILWRRTRRAPGGVLPLVSGRLSMGLFLYTLPATLLFYLGALTAIYLESESSFQRGGEALAVAMVALFVLIPVILLAGAGWMAALIPVRGRRAILRTFWALAGAGIFIFFTGLGWSQEYLWAWIILCVFSLGFLFFESLLLRLHYSETFPVKAGRLTTDPAAWNPLEILPDERLDAVNEMLAASAAQAGAQDACPPPANPV